MIYIKKKLLCEHLDELQYGLLDELLCKQYDEIVKETFLCIK